MSRVSLIRAQARALHAGALCALSLLSSACAGTTGSARSETLLVDYGRAQAPSAPANARTADLRQMPVLERATFVRAVLARNPSIEAARQAWRAALGRVRQSGPFDDPMVDVRLAPLSIGSSKARLGYELMVSQALPWFGKRSLDTAAAEAEAEATKNDFEGTQRDLALAALTLYDQYFVAQRSLEINAEHVELMRSMRDAATSGFASGRGSADDALQAEAELAHMEHDAVLLGSQRDILTAQMNELLHRSPEEPLPPPPAELEAVPGPDQRPAELERRALGNRRDIAAARQRARAAQARAERADRDAYPDFTLSTSYNSMWDMPEHRWMVGLGFNLPILSGKRSGMADEARAMQAQFQSEVARMSDTARTQVFVTLKQVQESEHVLRLFETRLLPIARERIDAARAGFVTGQNSFTAVIEAERNLRQAELEFQMTRAEHAGRRGELERALGEIPGLVANEGDR